MIKEMYYWMVYYLKKVISDDMPEFNAYLLMCLLVNANFLSVVMIISYFINFNLSVLRGDSKYIGFAGGVSMMIFMYFYLFTNRIKIIDKYDKLPQKRRAIGITTFWFYSILSLSLLFIVGVNMTK